jgi:hypothetical protein
VIDVDKLATQKYGQELPGQISVEPAGPIIDMSRLEADMKLTFWQRARASWSVRWHSIVGAIAAAFGMLLMALPELIEPIKAVIPPELVPWVILGNAIISALLRVRKI